MPEQETYTKTTIIPQNTTENSSGNSQENQKQTQSQVNNEPLDLPFPILILKRSANLQARKRTQQSRQQRTVTPLKQASQILITSGSSMKKIDIRISMRDL